MEQLKQRLSGHLGNIHETLQILDRKPPSLDKISWDQVLHLSQQLSNKSTLVGMLFTGEKEKIEAIQENMEAYFNLLQGLLLLAYGSTVGAGPTLSSNIHASIKQVVDCSFYLWRECVASYGSGESKQRSTIPQLTGTVWEACDALKKIPSSNIIAIGRAMTQVAVSLKDVLREMKELEPSSCDPTNESESQPLESTTADVDTDDEDDLGNDLSPEEMKIAQFAIRVVSETLNVVKELIRSITGLLKKEDFKDEYDGVESLEKLLGVCQSIRVNVDELGACLYPPQEFVAISMSCQDISGLIDEMGKELNLLNGSTEAFSEGCKALKNTLEVLKLNVSSALPADEVPQDTCSLPMVKQMQNLTVRD